MILLIDNYDSFTYNLYQALASQAGSRETVRVVSNDRGDLLGAEAPSHVVLSPGPGHPQDSRLSLSIADRLPGTPILGVCLGHQALALGAGADVGRAQRPVHGRGVTVHHDGSPLFAGIPSPFEGALYHSLAVDRDSLPRELSVCAWTDDGDIMGVRRVDRPHFGVQFHPESFMTDEGARLVRNFLSQ